MKCGIRIFCFLLCLLFLIPSFASCNREKRYAKEFFFMDTLIGVTLYAKTKAAADEGFSLCKTLLSELDDRWSKEKSGSLVDRINRAGTESFELDEDSETLFATALAVSQMSGGAFDVTVAPLVDLWADAEEKQELPTKEELLEVLACVGYQRLTLQDHALVKTDPNTQIDLGGIGKGAAISILIAKLSGLELSGGLVSFGSNIAVFGKKPDGSPFRVAIRDPFDEQGTIGTLTLSEGEVLSVSGDYERYVEIDGVKYHHILDSKTGYPAESGLSSAVVVARDGALADALSTALFCMGLEESLKLYEASNCPFEAILVGKDGSIHPTDGIKPNFQSE